MRARPGAVVHESAEHETAQLSLNRHHHVTGMTGGMNPAKVVEHAPIHPVQIRRMPICKIAPPKGRLQIVLVERIHGLTIAKEVAGLAEHGALALVTAELCRLQDAIGEPRKRQAL